jgi:ankyrin repeat protein
MKKIIFFVSMIIFSSNFSMASVPLNQCFDLYQNTKDEYKDISPVWAKIAIQSKLIENIRILGNFRSIENEHYKPHSSFSGNNLKFNAPQDAMSALIQHLFPIYDGKSLFENRYPYDPIGYLSLSLLNEIILKAIDLQKEPLSHELFKYVQIFENDLSLILDKIDIDYDAGPIDAQHFDLLKINFIKILRKSIIEEKHNPHQQKYPINMSVHALFAFALHIANDVQEIYTSFPWIFNDNQINSNFSERDYLNLVKNPNFEIDIDTEKLIRILFGNLCFDEKPEEYMQNDWRKNIFWDKTPLLLKGWMKSEIDSFDTIKQPSELFQFNLHNPQNAANAIDLILDNNWQDLYIHIPLLIAKGFFIEDHWSQKTVYTLQRLFEKNIDNVNDLIQASGLDINTKNEDGETCLHLLSAHWNLIKIKQLLDLGADPNLQNKKGETPILKYFSSDDFCPSERDIQKLSLFDGPNSRSFYIKNKKGNNIFTVFLTRKNSYSMAQKNLILFLLKQGFSVNEKDAEGKTLLHKLCMYSDCYEQFELIKILVDQKKANVNTIDNNGKTPLYYTWNKEIALYLIKKGANINYAERWCNDIDCLIQVPGLDINEQDENGDTALHKHIVGIDPKKIKKLLKLNTNPNIQNKKGETPILKYFYSNCCCSKKIEISIIDLLVKYGANLHIKDNDGNNILNVFLTRTNEFYENEKTLIIYLLNHEFSADEKDAQGKTILHKLCYSSSYLNHFELIKMLVDDKNVKIEALDNVGKTPMSYLNDSNKEIAIYLIRKGAEANCTNRSNNNWIDDIDCLVNIPGMDINNEDENGSTILHKYIGVYDLKKIKQLLDYGAKINTQNKKGETPILKHFHSEDFRTNKTEIEKLAFLSEYSVDLSLNDIEGYNIFTLYFTKTNYFTHNNINFIVYLLDQGFSVDEKNPDGDTLLDKLNEHPHRYAEFIKMLEERKIQK